MKRSFFLGLPLFHIIFCILYKLDLMQYRIKALHDPNLAPINTTGLLFMILLWGGYVLIAFLYGRHLFSRPEATPRDVVKYTILLFLIVLFILFVQMPGYFRETYWFIPVLEQTVGFLLGAISISSK